MKVDYFFLFKCGLAVLGVLILLQWLPMGCESITRCLPCDQHSSEYNYSAWIMIGLGVWGLWRLLAGRGRG
jgi:hypothetical protein